MIPAGNKLSARLVQIQSITTTDLNRGPARPEPPAARILPKFFNSRPGVVRLFLITAEKLWDRHEPIGEPRAEVYHDVIIYHTATARSRAFLLTFFPAFPVI